MKRPWTEAEALRAQELLLDRAIGGLPPAEAAELAALGAEGDDSFDLAAAALDLATVRIEAMPAGVAERILAAADAALRAGGQAAPLPDPAARPPGVPQTLAGVVPARSIDTALRLAEPPAPAPAPVEPAAAPPSPYAPGRGELVELADRARERRRARAPVIVAWMAAAACLALAVGAVLWARDRGAEVVAPALPASPAEARAELLASGDAATLPWTPTGDAAARGASGDVVWSASRQRGYLRFAGLAPNDPQVSQYQLWIFDRERDERFPVDGGVFDVTSSGEVIVAISPKLRVSGAVLFAVTVEPPGGVVVSKRERIVVTAAPT